MMPALLAALQFLRSPAGRYVAMAAAGALAIAAALWWHAAQVRGHDAALQAAWVAQQQAAVAAAVAQARADGDKAVAAAAAQARAAALAEAPVREVIHRVPIQTSCAGSPAVRAALDELRHPAAGPDSSATGAADRAQKLR